MAVSLQKRILLKAADLLEDRRRWTRRRMARDARSRPVKWNSEQAVRFCALGAIARITAEHGVSALLVAKFIDKNGGVTPIVLINDNEGRKAVIGYLRRMAGGA